MDGSVDGIYLPSRAKRLSRPLILSRLPAGFPSPAESYIEGRIDLNRELIKHPFSTFYIRVSGDSMSPLIQEGALLIVDRMAETRDGDIVVARIGDELCVKRFHIEQDGRIWLFSENDIYAPIEIASEMDFKVWGKVTCSIQLH
jgi:DNA polymerase V